jgi:hypothetical protein
VKTKVSLLKVVILLEVKRYVWHSTCKLETFALQSYYRRCRRSHLQIAKHSHPARKGVSCGIPDFHSKSGLYAALKEKNEYDLHESPQQTWVTLFVTRSRSVGGFDIRFIQYLLPEEPNRERLGGIHT